jgi:hypothetical protein
MEALSHCIVALVAWMIGLGAYVLALELQWQQSVSSLSWISLIGSSATAWAFAYPCVYVRVLLHHIPPLPWIIRLCLLPPAALLLGFVPVTLVWLSTIFFGTLFGFGLPSLADLRFFTSPEAGLFYWFFGSASIVVGLAFVFANSPNPSNQAMERTADRRTLHS